MVAIDKTTGPGSGASRQNKAEETTKAANLIIAAETAARNEKTVRLRQARLEMEAEERKVEQAAKRSAVAKAKRVLKKKA